MSDYRESSNAAKAVRRGIVEAKPVGGKKRHGKKTVIVECRYPTLSWIGAREWRKFGAYESREIAQSVVDQKSRTHKTVQYRIRP